MKSSLPKRHHYVPQMLLRHFADLDGKLYFFNKKLPEKGILKTTPENLFHEMNLYTAKQTDGTRDVKLERDYSDLESRANGIIEKILDSAHHRKALVLTSEEKETWDVFFYNQWKRVPDFHNRFFGARNIERHLNNILLELETRRGPLTPDEMLKLNDPEWKKRVIQNARVQSLTLSSPRILPFLRERGLVIAVITKPAKSFVIGSFPVVKLTLPDRAQLGDPTLEIWLPIAYDVAVAPTPVSGMPHVLVEIHEDRHIRNINSAILKQSTMIAARSRQLINSLIHSR